jgi:hypothetical protein
MSTLKVFKTLLSHYNDIRQQKHGGYMLKLLSQILAIVENTLFNSNFSTTKATKMADPI